MERRQRNYVALVKAAQDALNALVRVVNEQPTPADKARAIVVLAPKFAAIQPMLEAAVAAHDAVLNTASEDKDLATLRELARGSELSALALHYKAIATRFLGLLIVDWKKLKR
jgi:hypothetical protein